MARNEVNFVSVHDFIAIIVIRQVIKTQAVDNTESSKFNAAIH